ncbi:aminoacyl-tRNA hydrolase [Azoarcus sp. PA01]|nr:aminoacyl-tRNA hydrolase [Azoarcus sp. PA01]
MDGVTFVGITGSAGKTTTKDLAAAVLGTLGPCAHTVASENEPIFAARTVLETTSDHRSCIVELAAFRPNCLDESIRLLRPNIAVLTLIARDHYTRFKSVEGIAAEKGKLIDSLSADGTAVLNIDDPLVRSIGERCKGRVIWIGAGEGATLRLRAATSRWPDPLTLEIEFEGRAYSVRTGLYGTQLALPVLAALGVGVAAGVPIERAIAALAAAQPAEGRMQIVEGSDGVVFVRDDWKAPLWSLQPPLDFLRDANAKRKVAVIGTLSDYSLSASKLYPKIARQVLELADLVVFVGPHAMRALKARRGSDDDALHAFPDIRDAAIWLRTALRAGDLVLLKGSNRADHLVRLMLDRYTNVLCWRERCNRSYFCGRCSLVGTPGPSTDAHRHSNEPAADNITAGAPLTSTPVLVGLGNPGERYRHTPHNVGHQILDELVRAARSEWVARPEGAVSTIVVNDVTVKLLKPGTSMNHSGSVVRSFLEASGCRAEQCILVHDDVDIALGDVRIKRDGGDAGHKGVRSIISALGTGDITRIRVGVRRSGDERQARQLVLEKFSAMEEPALSRGVDRATAQVWQVVAQMNSVRLAEVP